MQLAGKIAVVTGAGSGIGLAIAKLFTSEGATVVAGDWNGERLGQAVADIRSAGGKIDGIQGDISDKASAEALVDFAVNTYGRVDILCNNAGIMDYMQGVGEVSDEIWRKVMAVNLDGPMYTSRRAAQQMLKQGSGSIINVASTAGLSGGAAGAAYTASKHGVVGLTVNTAWMYAKQGIRCNAICPGGTATNIAETMPQDKLDVTGAQRLGSFSALIPSFLQPSDIAALALFLASDASQRINGAVIPADAGWMAL